MSAAPCPAPATLADGALTVVAATLPASHPASWIRPGLSGYLAASCYVLAVGDQALIVDTGLGLHWEAIRDGLDRVLARTSSRSLIMTRREPDAIGNLPAIVARFGLRNVYCGGVISPVDFFERVDAASAEMSLRAIARTDVTWVHPGTSVRVGSLELEVLPTTLRVLPKNHLYDACSRTLFASDTWVLLPQPTPGSVGIVRTQDERLSVASIANDLRHRFEWLAGIDTAPMQQEIADLIAFRAIDRICPSYGGIIEGAALVGSVLRNTIEALGILSREPRISRLGHSDLEKMRTALRGGQGSAMMQVQLS